MAKLNSKFCLNHIFWLTTILALGFASRTPSEIPSSPEQAPRFWQITLELQLEGTYCSRQENHTFQGAFSGAWRWQGVMEPDEPDVILFHLETEVLKWELREKDLVAGKERAVLVSSSSPPRLKVDCLLRQADAFYLDFFLEPLAIPVGVTTPHHRLLLPASASQDLQWERMHYNEYVSHGSNWVVVPAKEIYSQDYEKNFSWSWTFPPGSVLPESSELTSEHQVKLILRIKAHFKN